MASRREMLSGLTRREWSALVAAAPLAAQSAAPEQVSAKAVTDVQQVKQRLTELQIPMHVEPCFRFVP